MSDLISWPRPHNAEGGRRPLIACRVFGSFASVLAPSRAKHRVGGMPEGLSVASVAASDPSIVALLEEETFADGLAEPGVESAVRSAPTVLAIQGELADSPTLDYLRDTVGIVAAALDAGGVAVLDVQTAAWWSPDDLRSTFLESEDAAIHQHVTTMGSEDDDGTTWLHTRGMRKFGRPDLSVRGVSDENEEAVATLIGRFIEMQALGGVIPEGQSVRMGGLPDGLTCRHGGSLDDPDFNNVHVEVRGLSGE